MSDNKTLVLFDFDTTITNEDSFYGILNLIKNQEVLKTINQMLENMDWVGCFRETFGEFKKTGIKKEIIQKGISEVELTKGMSDLLNHLKANKAKYKSYILSSNVDYIIKDYLKAKKVDEVFEDICAFHSNDTQNEINDNIDIPIYDKECDICKNTLCKSFEADKLINIIHPSRIFFI